MKKILSFILIGCVLFVWGCSKNVTLPPYKPPTSSNFSVLSLNHTKDTVNVGDTVYLTAAGTLFDSSSAYHIYAYLSVTATVGGVSTVYNYGSATTPITISRVIGAQNSAGQFTWTSTILLPGVTSVPHKTKLTISSNFIYQLNLSSEKGNLSATDAGIATKTVFVQ